MRILTLLSVLPFLASALNGTATEQKEVSGSAGLCNNRSWNCGQCFLTFRIGPKSNLSELVWKQLEVYDSDFSIITSIQPETSIINGTTNTTWLNNNGGFSMKATANTTDILTSIVFSYGTTKAIATYSTNLTLPDPVPTDQAGPPYASINVATGCKNGFYVQSGGSTVWQGFCGFGCI